MIKVTNYEQIKEFFNVPDEAIAFLASADESTACGRYEFGENCYVNVIESKTKTELAPMEAHEVFVDVQCLLVGEEKILYTDKAGLPVTTPYNEQKDVVFFDFTSADEVCYRAGEGIVLYPNEAHLPGRAVTTEMTVKKAVLKIAVALIR